MVWPYNIKYLAFWLLFIRPSFDPVSVYPNETNVYPDQACFLLPENQSEKMSTSVQCETFLTADHTS